MSTASIPGSSFRETANDRFKRQSRAWVWEAIAAAAALHFAAFAFGPGFTVAGPVPIPERPDRAVAYRPVERIPCAGRGGAPRRRDHALQARAEPRPRRARHREPADPVRGALRAHLRSR